MYTQMQLQYLKAINRLVVARVEQKRKNTDIYIFIQNHDFFKKIITMYL